MSRFLSTTFLGFSPLYASSPLPYTCTLYAVLLHLPLEVHDHDPILREDKLEQNTTLICVSILLPAVLVPRHTFRGSG